MTDEMRAKEKAICEAANVDDIGEVSDGFHTFNSLYEQRMILFAALVKAYKDKSWKSYRHEDGEYCFGGGWFIDSDGYYPYCSECRTEPSSGHMTDFCPNCGADMRGTKND